ncbi:MAG: PAS domain S-box protein [Gallionella sp.]
MKSDANIATPDILDEVFGETSVVFYTAMANGDFALSYVSHNIGRVLGVQPESCAGSGVLWHERVHVDDAGRIIQELAVLSATGCCTQEFRLRDDGGNYRWVSNEVAFKCDAVGNPAYLAGCLRDISEIKKRSHEFENHLKEQSAMEHFYRSVLNSLPQRLFWKDRNSVFRGCNLSGARALNLAEPCEIAGKTDYDFYSNHDEANYLCLHDERVMNSGQATYHAEVPARQGDTWLDVTKVPLHNENGEVYGLLVSYEDVSALKKSEMALHRFKRAVEQSSNSIFITDTAGNIEYVNPAFLGTYGYEEHEVLGKNARLLKSGLVPQETAMWQTILGGQSWRGELSNISKSGAVSWQRTSISPIFDESGTIFHFLAIEDDVTNRKIMEEALTESEARLHEITSTVGEGIYVVDTAGIITFVNPAAENLLGWSAKNLLGKNIYNTVNCPMQGNQCETDTKAFENRATSIGNLWLDKIRHQGKAIRVDNSFCMRKDGSQFQASIIATPIFRASQFAGAVVAFHDITEQMFTQKLLNDTLHELRTILDNAQIGIAYLRNNEFIWINKHMEEMFGYTADELLKKPMEMIHANDGQAGEIYGLLSKGEVYEDERLMKKSSGDIFWCHQRGIAIDPSDSDKGSIWIMLDIDRLKKTETHLEIMNETLAQRVEEETRKSLEKERLLIQQGRNAAMGEMIGNIAHQWRQPLSTLGLLVQNIHADYQEKILSDSTLEKYVETAQMAVQRMSSTIDDFRDFFRPNRAKVCFLISQSIHEAIRFLDAMLRSNGIAIWLTEEPGLETIGHPSELSQVILNCMVNAKEALVTKKTPQAYIAIELAKHDGFAAITIRDNAGGIPEDNLERVFDPYFTTKPSGTGIGLYMSKTIVEKHMGGSITCRNAPEGAEFTITIPLEPDCEISKNSGVNNGQH